MSGAAHAGPRHLEIAGGRVARIRGSETGDASDPNLIDLSAYTVLPGLIDAHSHLSIDTRPGADAVGPGTSHADPLPRALQRAELAVRSGVTTIRLAGEPDYLDVTLKARFESGSPPGPRLITAGFAIQAARPTISIARAARGGREVALAVRENVAHGVDHIKLFATGGMSPGPEPTDATLTAEEIRAAAEAAHAAGRTICAHAHGGTAVDDCLDAGIDHIEHGNFLHEGQLARMAELGRWLVATLGVYLTRPGPAEDPRLTPASEERHLRARRAAAGLVERARRAGVRIALGTDAMHGQIAEEVIHAASGGLSNEQALAAVTVSAAEMCGLRDEIGTLAVGARADLIAVRGHPFDDPTCLRDVRFVMCGGETIYDATGRGDPAPGSLKARTDDRPSGGSR